MTDGDGPATGSEATDDDASDSAASDADLPEGWTLWNDEPGGRVIYAYRPDVFDTEQFPPACLPTLYVAAGPPNRPAAEAEYGPTEVWRVQFFLEPEVELIPARTYDTRADALADAHDLAGEFARGELDHRGAYQVPREEYLDRLDELTGDGGDGSDDSDGGDDNGDNGDDDGDNDNGDNGDDSDGRSN